jgi:hypothetical protein
MPISSAIYENLRRALVGVGLIVKPAAGTALSASPSITAGTGAASDTEPNGSVYLRTNGDIAQRISGAWVTALSGGRAARVTAPFKSTEQTGTGSPQNIAHGLGVVPSVVTIQPSNLTGGVYVVVEGTHTSTNVVVTVTSGEKYLVVAYA